MVVSAGQHRESRLLSNDPHGAIRDAQDEQRFYLSKESKADVTRGESFEWTERSSCTPVPPCEHVDWDIPD